MPFSPNRRTFIGILACSVAGMLVPAWAQEERKRGGFWDGPGEANALPPELAEYALLSLVLGRVTDRSVTVSALAREPMEGYLEYGTAPGVYSQKTPLLKFPAGEPLETVLDHLAPGTGYFYRISYRKPGETTFRSRAECRFHSQRAAGDTFVFGVQGDSHPERPQMHDATLYARTLLNAAAGNPDFYICLGDDFSVDKLREFTPATLAQPYLLQRPFLGLIGQTAPLFLVNGNHEQASRFNFNQADERHAVATGAQNARNRYYPTPQPTGFYTGDAESPQGVGPLKDYYAWTWGDALFVVLDNYWHSPAQVDSGLHGGHDKGGDDHKNRDWWGITLGDTQYQWLKRTLEQSRAKYKFVFAHHVLGTGRGGVEEADLYEWGGRNRRGDWEFARMRPGWELPIHQLMAKHGVTIFFHGHDHLFARQERDGVVYQEVPIPADPNYRLYNGDRYETGVKLPNTGYVRVTVSPAQVKVDYIRCYLPKDETAQQKTGEVAYSYTVPAKTGHA